MATVELEIRGDVAVITLDRPAKLNAIDDEMLDGLLAAIEAIGRTDAVGAAVLTGRGRAFSAGGDITAMAGMDESVFAATIAQVHAASPPRSARAGCRSSRPSTATPWPVASSSPCCATSGSPRPGRSSACRTPRSA